MVTFTPSASSPRTGQFVSIPVLSVARRDKRLDNPLSRPSARCRMTVDNVDPVCQIPAQICVPQFTNVINAH